MKRHDKMTTTLLEAEWKIEELKKNNNQLGKILFTFEDEVAKISKKVIDLGDEVTDLSGQFAQLSTALKSAEGVDTEIDLAKDVNPLATETLEATTKVVTKVAWDIGAMDSGKDREERTK
ncbi:unnamed protein product [Ilex paraguariensis]|uniref:Uncharacterized protein n=1 Tax=Ilex paraguariensis TaxID=185542 RepID=A0ABC8RXC5_9AQUA